MHIIPQELLAAYRAQSFRTYPDRRLRTQDDAVAFVNERGFVYLWPITGILLPSLWAAVAGDRPVADAHDDPGHVTWGWKDSLLGKGVWYYAKVLRKKATMIALNMLPNFYALSENYGSPEDDYLTLYEQGRLTQEAKTVYDVLLREGPLDTIALRRTTHMTSHSSKSRFDRALRDLQVDFKIMPIGIARTGGWRYAFIYDLVSRQYPEVIDQAQKITENKARQELTETYLRSVGACQERDVKKLFGWRPVEIERAIDDLTRAGVLYRDVEVENEPGKWLALQELF